MLRYEAHHLAAKNLFVGAASRRDSRRGSFRVLLTPLTYIPVGDGAPTILSQDLSTSYEIIAIKTVQRYSISSRVNCCPVMPRLSGPARYRKALVTSSGDLRVLLSSAG